MSALCSEMHARLNPFQNVVQSYVESLRQGVEEDSAIKMFRDRFSHRFEELCMVHLSVLIDVPWDMFDCRLTTAEELTQKPSLKRLLMGSRTAPHDIEKTSAVPKYLINGILELIRQLDTDEVCAMEGIFRKTGNIQRKREIQKALLRPDFSPDAFAWQTYNAHDLTNALKSVLAHLSPALLTNRLMPLFLQVAGLRKLGPRAGNTLECIQFMQLVESKQLKAIRLLIQMLPQTSQCIIRRLLLLLSRVARHQETNRMSIECLGTIFAPVLFPAFIPQPPLKLQFKNSPVTPLDCQLRCRQVSALVTILIQTGLDIFLLPSTLAEDCHANLSQFMDPGESNSYSPQPKRDSSPPLRTGIRFATPTGCGLEAKLCIRLTPKSIAVSPADRVPSGIPEGAHHVTLKGRINVNTCSSSGRNETNEDPAMPRVSPTSASRGPILGDSLKYQLMSVRHATSVTDLSTLDPGRPRKKRRYTEIKTACTAPRRCNLLSSCPPITFSPFRRLVAMSKCGTPSSSSQGQH